MHNGFLKSSILIGCLLSFPAQSAELLSMEGRWRQIGLQQDSGHRLEVGTIEITRCDKDLCGRLVQGSTCGGVVMRLTTADKSDPRGELKLGDTSFSVALRPDPKTKGHLILIGSEGAHFLSRTSMPVSAELEPEGSAQCSASPAS